MGPALTCLDEVIAVLQKALPKRPSFPELEIAIATITKIDEELAASKNELLQNQRPVEAPGIVFSDFQEMRLEAAEHRANEQKQAAVEVLELEERHRKYDQWIWRVHAVLLSSTEVDVDADVDVDVDADANASAAYADCSEGVSERAESKDAQGSARSVLDATWDFPPSESSVTSSVGLPTLSLDGQGLNSIKSSAYQRSDSFSRVSHSLSWSNEQVKPNMQSGNA
ncbi:hypothetical protein L7F22_034150 [Adiantum nelumboides]|nr:hypothetical protein [Adiantum nelumboides]MCO5580284.1 hypothetical protein [Adiantum nelumboides]